MITQSKPRLRAVRLTAIMAALAMMAGLLSVTAPTPQAASAQTTDGTITVDVVSARTEADAPGGPVTEGDPVTAYEFMINLDDTGTLGDRANELLPGGLCHPETAGYPGTCPWTSIAGVSASSSPVVTQGTEADLAGGLTLPAGDYLISVLADGYKLDGEHFTVTAGGTTAVTVEVQPFPLPTSTLQSAVFEDISPTNGAPDLPVERGLAGWEAFVFDYAGEVSTDAYGNPLGTEYDTNGDPIPGSGGQILSKCYVVSGGVDIGTVAPTPIPGVAVGDPHVGRCPNTVTPGDLTLEGVVIPDGAIVIGKAKVPNLQTNRWILLLVSPDGSGFIQTTSLEGNHDWDWWAIEGATGLDTEFAVAAEPFPFALSGWVLPNAEANRPALTGTGSITGNLSHVKVYIPPKGGISLPGDIWGGTQGLDIAGPITDGWLSLNDLNNGDTAVWIGRADANGDFTIPDVPAGNYQLTWWDEAQIYILDLTSVIVDDGEHIDMGVLPLTGWYTELEGYIFLDSNRNGKRDPGEEGIGGQEITVRKRENSLIDRGGAIVTATDPDGFYSIRNTYPMIDWQVMEVYNDLFYTTGVTYQADNQPTETTSLGAGVDVSFTPIISLGGRIDWGLHPYDPSGANGVDPRNGGIVGTVSYDTTRAERDPQYAGAEDWQPSIPGMTVNLYAPVFCGTNAGEPCDTDTGFGFYEVDANGELKKGQPLNSVITERWERPTNCTPRDVDGNPLVPGVDENVMPRSPADVDDNCLEGPLLGVQFDTGDPTHATNPGVAVDGNYGFGDGCFAPGVLTDANGVAFGDPGFDSSTEMSCLDGGGASLGFTALPADDYLVEVVSAEDHFGEPIFTPTREEDINVNDGVEIIVPQVPPPSCAGPMHIVDVEGSGSDAHPDVTIDGVTVTDTGEVSNPSFADAGGTIYEGQARRLCDTKLVSLNNGSSIAPTFLFFTEVPLPGRLSGLMVDNQTFATDNRSLLYGEKMGIPFAPVGIYDFDNRLVTTVETDFNGMYDVLLPSTNVINAASPSGVAANMYRFVGNDPGIPGALNLNYNPLYRTIAADFEVFPGLIVPTDLAPTQTGVQIQLPGGQLERVSCPVPAGEPQLYAVDVPYVNGSGSFTITGADFGATTGQVTLDGTAIQIDAWTDSEIQATVPAGHPSGPQQMEIVAANGAVSSNGLTFHVLGAGGGGGGNIEPPFPANGVLDDFNRDNGNLGSTWAGTTQTSTVRIQGDAYAEIRRTTRIWWSPEGTGAAGQDYSGGGLLDADQEAFLTFRNLSTRPDSEQGLLLKYSGSENFGNTHPSNGAAFVQVTYNPGATPATTGVVEVKTKNRAQAYGARTVQASFPMELTAGDTLGARTLFDGTTVVYVNGAEIGRVDVVAGGWDADLAAHPGSIGAFFVRVQPNGANPQNAEFDDFGGGSVALNSTGNLDDLAFPYLGTLDDFDRANGRLGGSRWAPNPPGSDMRIRSQGNIGGDIANVQVRGAERTVWNPNVNFDVGRGVFDSNQEAWFTFEELSPRAASQQGLLLKKSGNGFGGTNANSSAAWIEVSYSPDANNAPNQGEIVVWTKPRDVAPAVVYEDTPALSIPGVTVNVGDTLGARTLSDGTTVVYLNGTEIGRVDVTDGDDNDHPLLADTVAKPGSIGVVFRGMGNAAAIARFDDFGGGSLQVPLTAGGGYNPRVIEVGPGRTYEPDSDSLVSGVAEHAIQLAIDDAESTPGEELIVVYPSTPTGNQRINPRGAYYENLLISKPVKLQGVGPGSPDGSVVGSIIDGGAFSGDSPVFDDWQTRLNGMTWAGNQTVFDGATITLYAETDNVFPVAVDEAQWPQIDGFDIRGGDQQGFPGNINFIGGGATGEPAGQQTQGGAIYSNGHTPNLQITNNVIQNNGGAYGTVRIGNPDMAAPLTDNHNDNVVIANNRVVGNGGTNLAGAIGLFAGADNYEVANNDICGNSSGEYGGGISHYGYSPGGSIHHNRIALNQSLDEGGGVMIAGALPTDPTLLSDGAGPVDIHDNLIQANLANDDGGGLRFLMAGDFEMNVFNNMIVNNISTHEGGGVSINDAPQVNFFNNTVMRNMTTATARTSTGIPSPAGLASNSNSVQLQATLPATADTFSNPVLFNNIFWDNRAGTRTGGTVIGVTAADADVWDLGVVDGSGLMSPVNSIISQPATGATPDRSYNADATNSNADPLVVDAIEIGVTFQPWRNNPGFVGAILVAADVAADGDYHLTAGSPAIGIGAASVGGVAAPTTDIDGDPRGPAPDAGADEQG